ncbi:MAG: DUF2501 domain-containing protein [Geminicoccaceae bacterium]
MKHGLALAVIGACAACWSPAVSPAQSLNDLTGALGGKGGGLSALGGGLPDLGQASTGNLAGVLQYCIKHKYLGGGDASSIEQSLMGKLGGASGAKKDKGFTSGAGGLLQTGGGKSVALGGDGLQQKVTDQVCDLVLEHAQSLL